MERARWLVMLLGLLSAVGCGGGDALPATAVAGGDDSPRGGDFERALAVVDRLEVNEVGGAPVQIFVTAFGNLPDGCTNLDEVTQDRDGEAIEVVLTTVRPTDAACTEALVPFQQTIALDVLGLQAGSYTVTVNGVVAGFELPAENVAAPATTGEGEISGRVWHDVCGILGGEGGVPAVPGPGCTATGESTYAADGVYEATEPGVAGVRVTAHEGSCPPEGEAAATAVTDANGAYRFEALPPGPTCISVDALVEPNLSLLVPGDWTFPAPGLAQTAVNVPAGETVAGVDFGWDHQFLPLIEPRDCVDRAGFVQDVTVPDNSVFDGGESFVKTWRLRNDGACAWDETYALVFVDGERMGGATLPLPATEPGSTADISVDLVAPDGAGTYRGDWMLREPLGTTFGIGPQGNGVFWVQIVSRGRTAATPSASPEAATNDAVLSGRVWLDVCSVAGGEGGEPLVPSDGCVATDDGGYQANGAMEAAEPGVPGVVVSLREGACGGPEVAVTSTAADGSYAFANLAGGEYCVVIDALVDENALRLIPGGWTTPIADSPVAEVLISLPAGSTRADVNFGWDFQLD